MDANTETPRPGGFYHPRTTWPVARTMIDPKATEDHVCATCGERFTLPAGTAVTRGSRPCGWSH
jgi:hypothetical protein